MNVRFALALRAGFFGSVVPAREVSGMERMVTQKIITRRSKQKTAGHIQNAVTAEGMWGITVACSHATGGRRPMGTTVDSFIARSSEAPPAFI